MIDLSGGNLRGSRDSRPLRPGATRTAATDSTLVTLSQLADDKHNSNTDSYLKVKGRLNISDTYITDFIIQSDVHRPGVTFQRYGSQSPSLRPYLKDHGCLIYSMCF